MNKKDRKENKIIFRGIGFILLILAIFLGKSFSPSGDENLKKKEVQKESVYEDYKYITPAELYEKINNKENLILLDIRDSVSFEKNHIQDSINISSENFEKTIESLDKEKTIVIIGYDYDKKTDVAAVIKKLKTELEFKNTIALTGGIVGWAEEGNPLIGGGDKESVIDWSKIDYIIPEQLKLAIDNNYPVLIIDVRKNSTYKMGHIPKAINIPLEEIEQRRSEISISKEILVYGSNSDEDFKASVKLNDLGFLATYTLKGGFGAWQEKRFEIEK